MTNSECLDGSGPIKSTAKSYQGPSGNEVDQIGSGRTGRATGWHPWHARQCLSVALPIPGHHTLVLRFYLVPITPKWPSWASAKVLGCSLLGIITHVPLSTSWPMTQLPRHYHILSTLFKPPRCNSFPHFFQLFIISRGLFYLMGCECCWCCTYSNKPNILFSTPLVVVRFNPPMK